MNEEIIRRVDIACITDSAIVNGTLFKLLEWCEKCGVKYILYGVTIKEVDKILGYDVFCPRGLLNIFSFYIRIKSPWSVTPICLSDDGS